MSNHWAVFRQDFMGNDFLVERNLTEQRARELVIEYESHKHHQHYWVCELDVTPIDYSAMLQELLNLGSSLDMSLKVLRNQNASTIQCVKAVQDIRKIDLAHAKRIVLESPVFSDQQAWKDSLAE